MHGRELSGSISIPKADGKLASASNAAGLADFDRRRPQGGMGAPGDGTPRIMKCLDVLFLAV